MTKDTNAIHDSTYLNLVPIQDVINSIDDNSAILDPMQQIAQWCVSYLCSPNADIGRPGVVCPWSPVAMKKETFWLTKLTTQGRTEQAVCQEVLSAIDCFNQQLPRSGPDTQYKTIVTNLHDIYPEDRVNQLHALLKPAFLEAGLMLGEFFSTCEKSGLRNPAFRPLRSPIPSLVVREMLEFDIAFLADSEAHVRVYLKRHGEKGQAAIRTLLKRRERIGFTQEQITVLEDVMPSICRY